MDYELLAAEFLRALRGKRSQVAMSRRLGYRSNVVANWEAGRRFPRAAEALRVVSQLGGDLVGAIELVLNRVPEGLRARSLHSREAVAMILDELRGAASVVGVARRSGYSRFALARWLSGAAEPRLPDFLQLLELLSFRCLDFVGHFVDPGQLPAARDHWERTCRRRTLAYEVPYSEAVLLALELEEYRDVCRHEPGWIAAALGISLEEEEHCLQALSDAGAIEQRDGKWWVDQSMAIDTRADPDALRRTKQFWAKVGLQRLANADPGQYSYNLVAVSAADIETLRRLHIDYFERIRQRVAESTPSQRVALVNIQLIPLGGDGAGS
jgi:hypothetical protein